MDIQSSGFDRYQRASTLLVVAGQSFNPLAAIALVAALPSISRHFAASGNSVFFAQLVMVAPCVSIIVGAPMAGKLGNFVGTRRLIIASIFIYVFAGCFGMVSPGQIPLILSRIILGFASGFLQTLCVNETGALTAARRDRLLGIGTAVAGIATIAGISAGAWLSGRLGWHGAFLLYCWPLPLLPLILLSKPEARSVDGSLEKDGYFDPIRKHIWIFLLELLLCLMLFAPNIEGPFVLLHRGLNEPSLIGAIISAGIGVSIATSSIYGWISKKLAPAQILRIVFSVFLVSAGLITFTKHELPAEVGLVISGIAGGLLVPLLLSMLLSRALAHQSATALGWFASTMFGSQLADPFLFNLIKTYLQISVFEAIFFVCSIALVLLTLRSHKSGFPDSVRCPRTRVDRSPHITSLTLPDPTSKNLAQESRSKTRKTRETFLKIK